MHEKNAYERDQVMPHALILSMLLARSNAVGVSWERGTYNMWLDGRGRMNNQRCQVELHFLRISLPLSSAFNAGITVLDVCP